MRRLWQRCGWRLSEENNMTKTEAVRVLSALMKQQQELPPNYRDLDNKELLALGKAIKTLRLVTSREV